MNFSVIIPVHNKAPHLYRSIESVLRQTHRSFELIIIDDASTDGSRSILNGFEDKRIRFFQRNTPGPGGYAARNLGIKEANYEWAVFLDADDTWEASHLDDIYSTILEFENVEIVSTNWNTSKNDTKTEIHELKKFKNKYSEFSLTDFFYTKSLMWTGALAIKTDLLKRAGLFPEGKCKRGGDMDTWIRCLYKSQKNVFINIVSATYYKDSVNQVTDNNKNPAIRICAEDTIESIRSKTGDKILLKAIDVYCASFAFNMSVNLLRRNGGLAINCIRMIESSSVRYKVLAKLYVYKLLLSLKLK